MEITRKFPAIETETTPAMAYISKHLMPIIYTAGKKGCGRMIFRNAPDHIPNHTYKSQYGLTTLVDAVNIIWSYYNSDGKWLTLLTEEDFKVPHHKDIAEAFWSLGYEVLNLDRSCFIINWSHFLIGRPYKQKPIVGVYCGPPVRATVTTPIPTPILSTNDFFYVAALAALKEKKAVEIHFLHSTPGQLKFVKPPSADFLSFTMDLNLLIDQRHELHYDISYRCGSQQETLIVMTFPLTAAKKIIANI